MASSFRASRLVIAALVLALAGGPALAEPQNYLRDTEIENDIRAMASPIFRAAGLEPNDIGIYLVEDAELNSFVAGGQNIFLNSGLILRAATPNQLIGVIAHETGHIAGGHITRAEEAMRHATIEGIIALVLGAAASIAGRNGAGVLGATGVAERSYLAFSITQEASADQAAMTFLDRTHQSARGLLQFFEILQSEEMLSGEHEDPYLRTHPLTSQRVEYLRHRVEVSRWSDVPDTPTNIALLQRVKVKLKAFLDNPSTTLAAYPERDQSVLARYARAIAYYRIPKLDKALPIVDGLIHDYPDDPFYRELKGQMLFENGRVRDAMHPYEEAVRLDPSAPLLRVSLAQIYIESNDASLNKRAIAYLNDAVRSEGKEENVWHLLATAYGRDNQFGMAALSLAEEALAGGKKKDALQQSTRAKQLLPKNTVAYFRADDIHHEAEKLDSN